MMGQIPRLYWDGFGLQNLNSGVARHALGLAGGLRSLGINPHILASVPQLAPEFAPWILPAKTNYPRSNLKPYALWLSKQEGQAHRDWKQDSLIHGLSNYNVILQRQARLKQVLTVHDIIPLLEPGSTSLALSAFLRWQLPRALDRADAIICVSRWTESTLWDRYPQTRAKTIWIPNGIEDEVLPKGAQIKRPTTRLLTLARDEKYKRLDLILPILQQLPEHFEWYLVTDFKGQKRLSISQAHPRLHIQSQLGDLALAKLWDETDLLVHPSLWEGFCLPAAEARRRLIPIVYCRASGIDEVVAERGQGLSREAGPSDWVEAIIRNLGKDFALSQAEGVCASSLNWQQVAERTLALYAKLSR